MVDNGISGGDVVTGVDGYVIVVFCCIALYNVIELTFIIWGYFRRHSGVYFWSFMVATYGIIFYALGFVFKAKVPSSGSSFYVTFIAVGWVAVVTGQSMVLWSRLHIVLYDQVKLRLILYMIIFDAITMHTPIIVMVYGANSSNPDRWIRPYNIYEKVQVTVFFIQETIISSFYIIATLKLARIQTAIRNVEKSRRLMYHVIAVNIIIIMLDCTILGLEYANYYDIQTAYKAFAYSVKLKLEFPILNRLKEMTLGRKDSSGARSNTERSGQRRGTFDTEMNQLCTVDSSPIPKPPDVCYSAYAVGGRRGHDDALSNNGDYDVVKTTEVLVEHEDRPSRDGKPNHYNFGEGPSGLSRSVLSEDLSKSSSELPLTSKES